MHETIPFEKIRRVVALGDSITFGMSATSPEKCWVSRLGVLLNELCGHEVEVLNKGISSNILCVESPCYDASAKPAGIERVESDVIAEDPDLVIIAYGLNDSRGGTEARVFRRDYQALIDRIREKTHAVIVVTDLFYMHEVFYDYHPDWFHSDYDITEEFNVIIRQLAKKNGLLFADVYATQQGLDWAVCDDHCHPNDLGHLLIANKIFETIVRGGEHWAD